MSNFREILRNLARELTEENYDEYFAKYRFWLDLGFAQGSITVQDQVDSGDVWRTVRWDSFKDLINPTIPLFIRFIGDLEADRKVAGHALGLHKHFCKPNLDGFFEENFAHVGSQDGNRSNFLTRVNIIAYWVNLGHVEEGVVRNHILQSLISHPKLYDHQAEALIVLLKLAGATFEACAGATVVDRCFELLKDHYSSRSVNWGLVQVRAPRAVKGGHWAKTNFQEVVALRESGWEGLLPPPALDLGPVGADRGDPAVTPVTLPLGLPSGDLEPQILYPPPPEPITTPETNANPESPVPQSPSISIATLSDFTVAGTSDDEFLDPTVVIPHDTLYFEDGNVEVLCGNTLFCVHTSVLSLHSPVLGRMLAKTNLATAESPNGCPRIPSSDTATDFATLLKVIYLPGYAATLLFQGIVPLTTCAYRFPERNKVPDFTTFSSLLRITAKYEMPTVRPQMLDVVRDAYPENFEGLVPSKLLGERVFSGPTPHPNEVLNLFVQQNLASALPMAYYMAARRGLDSLMNNCLPASAILPPEILKVAIRGLMTLREMELKETHRLVFGSKGSRSCSLQNCPSCSTMGPGVSEAHQKVVDRIADSAYSGTKLLQVLSLKEICGGDCFGFCGRCVNGWEAGHADVRKKVWAALPDVFGLKG